MLACSYQPNSAFPTRIAQALNVHPHAFFPRQQVIRQTLLADWNRERINSRWYHWEKMEHNVENAPCQATTSCNNEGKEQPLGMHCNRESKCMPCNIQHFGTGVYEQPSYSLT